MRTRTRGATALGALLGLVATNLLLGVVTSGASLMGLDLLVGGLLGAAAAQRLTTGRVSYGLRVSCIGAAAIFALAAGLALLVLLPWGSATC